jgi:predicted nicotinamide N-methyase
MNRRSFILDNTVLASPLLCPEIRLHLITDSCPLWHATEPDLAELGLADPYWGFCWAGGQALSRFILDHPEVVEGKRVLEFGAGCGIEAIAAMKAGARHVLASDIDPMAAEATQLNGLENSVSIETTTWDLIGNPLPGFEVVLAGDMFYDPSFTQRVVEWLASLTRRGIRVFLGDPYRGNLSTMPIKPLTTYRAPADVDIAGRYLQDTTVYECF